MAYAGATDRFAEGEHRRGKDPRRADLRRDRATAGRSGLRPRRNRLGAVPCRAVVPRPCREPPCLAARIAPVVRSGGAATREEQLEAASVGGEPFQLLLGCNAVRDRVPDHEHLRAVHCCGERVIGDSLDGFEPGFGRQLNRSRAAIRAQRNGFDSPAPVRQQRIGCADRILYPRAIDLLAWQEQPLACLTAQRRRQQQRVTTGGQVPLEDVLEDALHVGVRGVHFVDDEQVTQEGGGAKVRVPHPHQGRKQHLVDRADHDTADKEPLRVLRGPASVAQAIVVGPRRGLRTAEGASHRRHRPGGSPERPARPPAEWRMRAALRREPWCATASPPTAWAGRSRGRPLGPPRRTARTGRGPPQCFPEPVSASRMVSVPLSSLDKATIALCAGRAT